MAKIGPLLHSLVGDKLVQIKVDENKRSIWRRVIPAYVERARKWEHRADCEYAAASSIPLSLETGKPLLCSCGAGVLPEHFISDIPHWNLGAKYAVRAAISPPFPVPLAEELFTVDSSDLKKAAAADAADVHPRGGDSECWNCRKTKNGDADGSVMLLVCSACHVAKYCSRSCQRSDWTKHKRECGKSLKS